MADNVQDMTLEILKGIQASLAELRADMGRQFQSFAQEARKDRRNIKGRMAFVQASSGDFDERIRGFDDRVGVLEDRAL